MLLEKKSIKDLLEKNEVVAEALHTDDNMSIEYYHLYKNNSLHINFEKDDDKATLTYLVLEGSLDLILSNEVHHFSKYDLFSVDSENPFEIYATSELKVLFVTATETDIDQNLDNLTSQIKDLEKKDVYLKGHNYRVGKYSLMILNNMHLGLNTNNLNFAASFHDIGKIKIDESIVNKEGKLTKEEFEEIKKHPVYSYEILKEILGEEVALIARYHHEKLDGTGYPDGIKEDEIPFESKIISIADIFDALTTDRSYRKKYSFAEALEIMEKEVSDHKIDSKAFNALCSLVHDKMIVEGVDNI